MKYLLDGQKTDRIHFQPVDWSHADEWLPFFQDPITRRYWVADYAEPEVECRRWYDRQAARYESDLGGMNALIERSSGRLIGHAGLLVQTIDDVLELEIAYSLLPTYWNMGYATEAACHCRDKAFGQEWAAHLVSIISLPNLPSARVAEKVGLSVWKQTLYRSNPVNIYRITRAAYDAKIR
ncbi:MAG: GNAT family N-acetyltransferase [Saprospiraceae bacterium]|nr:GNAT family N-acetyltransferase [Saprospiraceae bacterium]